MWSSSAYSKTGCSIVRFHMWSSNAYSKAGKNPGEEKSDWNAILESTI